MEITALHSVVDAIDIETYLACSDAKKGHALALRLGKEMNLGDVDIMFEEFDGYGVRVRLRKYIHRPAQRYHWLESEPQ
jgi:hypothetical protein